MDESDRIVKSKYPEDTLRSDSNDNNKRLKGEHSFCADSINESESQAKNDQSQALLLIGLAKEVILTARKMNSSGINQGKAGNVSSKLYFFKDGQECCGFLITPTGIEYDSLTEQDIVLMDLESRAIDTPFWKNTRLPSSEHKFHADIYKNFKDAEAIVHTHSKHATALSCSNRSEFIGLRAFHYYIAFAGTTLIPVCDYAVYGSQALSDNIVKTIRDAKSRACFMQNHGVVCYEKSLKQALNLASVIELMSEQYIALKSAGIEPKILTDLEMEEVLNKVSSYGQQK